MPMTSNHFERHKKSIPTILPAHKKLVFLTIPLVRICGKICIFARQQPINRQGVALQMHHIKQENYSIVIRLLLVCYSIKYRRTVEYEM